MQTEIMYGTSFALARITLAPGEQIRAEAGAMVSMDASMKVDTGTTGGLFKSLKRSVMGGESFFMNTFTADNDGSELTLAPALLGAIEVLELQGSDMMVQSGSYLASEMGIEVDTKWGGARSFFGGEGLFLLKCSGRGTLVISSYGAIHKVSLQQGRTYTVDTGHIVAFDSTLSYNIRKVGSWKSTILGGEGLVVDFAGSGDVYLQTRSPESFLGWLIPKLPTQRS
jgi:uncharacterized protein (TIGR00266 family)